MGKTPDMSVVNRWHQCWDVPNLFIIDGSVLTTGGVVNPTSTVWRWRCARPSICATISASCRGTTRPLAA